MSKSRSIFNRLTLLAVLIGVIVTVLLYLAAHFAVRHNSDAALARTVDTDTAGLVDIYATGGQVELGRRLQDRLSFATNEGDRAHYLLATASGKRIAGDVASMPRLDAGQSQAAFTTLVSGPQVFARATALSPDLQLLVAREYGSRSALLKEMAMAFLLAGLGVVLMLILAGHQASKGLRNRVAAINGSFERPDEVSMESADAQGTTQDELDMLAAHVRSIIKRQSALIISHKSISDQTAHELRTPLMHLDMRLQRAVGQSADAALTETIVKARAEIKKIVRMLESLLDIAANEAQGSDLSQLPETNISELAISMVELFQESAHELGLALETAISPNVIMRCEPMQMTRMISNLLDNALKYVPSGGTIRLTVAEGPHISVADDGPGVPKTMWCTIFERFQRAGDAHDGGHGLGLALVKSIAERHGLSVRCEDAEPGAAFIAERRSGT